jgi:hypothetical protein
LTADRPAKSLKDQNRWQLWLTIAANVALFFAVAQTDVFATSGIKAALMGGANLLPVGFALIITTIANGLLSADLKARLVFLRWKYALPGHRAFSKYALSDPRVDVERLEAALGGKLPAEPEHQNRVWYCFFKEVEYDPAVQHIHREFLFTRDYAGFAALFLVAFGTAAIVMVQSLKVSLTYGLCLLLQFLIVRHAASTYGARFVTTVLARKSATAASAAEHSRKKSSL